jgi:glucokinase
MTNTKRYVVGADLGGTNVRAALIEEETGTIVARSENVSSKALLGPDLTAAQIAYAVDKAISEAGVDRSVVRGVGLAVPGHIRPSAGMVLWAPNFYEQWRGVPLARLVSDQVKLPVYLGNDANLAALGESTYGIGRGTRHLVLLTLGTGVGGGVIIDGRMLLGHDGGAAELGHMLIAAGENARGGNAAYGSLEGLVQRDAIIERASRKLSLGRDSLLAQGPTFVRADLTPKAIADAALAGDAVAIETLDEVGHYVGLGVASCINIFNPEIVVIGGGIAQAGDLLMAPIIRSAKVNAVVTLFATCRIVLGGLGDNAGIMGAAALIEHEMSLKTWQPQQP